MTNYLLTIIRTDQDPVYLIPGGTGERELITAIVDATLAKGVGVLRTKAHVKTALTQAILEVVHSLKSEVLPTI